MNFTRSRTINNVINVAILFAIYIPIFNAVSAHLTARGY